MSFVPTVFPSLVHVIFGVGFPVALQWNITVAPSVMVLSLGLEIKLGASVINSIRVELNYAVHVQFGNL